MLLILFEKELNKKLKVIRHNVHLKRASEKRLTQPQPKLHCIRLVTAALAQEKFGERTFH